MLLIETVYEEDNLEIDYVKCPSCKRGRLCDKAAGEKATVIAVKPKSTKHSGNWIKLKCPKCSKEAIIRFL